VNIVAIIEARMASTRLPGKVMRGIYGRPMLDMMVERVRMARTLDDVVVATTIRQADDQIYNFCKRNSIAVWRGSEDDVLHRVLQAAYQFEADVIVELTGDCPLIDPAMIDKVVGDYMLGGADFVYNRLDPRTPIGMDVRVFSTKALAELNEKTTDPADREHVSLHFWEHPKEYRCRNVFTQLPKWASSLRLTVDTEEDFSVIEKVFFELYPFFGLFDILNLYQEKPELFEDNAEIQQKAAR